MDSQLAYMSPRLREAVDKAARDQAPDRYWCAACQQHRTRTETALCPVCEVPT